MPDYTKQSDFDIAFESLMARRKKEIRAAPARISFYYFGNN